MIMPCVLGTIRRTFEEENERAMELGLWGIVSAAGAALEPLIGGALLAHFWWGSNVPVMLIVLPLVFLLLPRTEQTTPGRWGLGQALLLITGSWRWRTTSRRPSAPLTPRGWHSPRLLTLFARLQLRSTTPMLDLSLFSRPAILAGIMTAIVATGALAGVAASNGPA